MRVLIAGSSRSINGDSEKQAFISACKDIGAALARAGMEFVVGSSSSNTADKWVIEGAATVAGTHRVFFYRIDDESEPQIPVDDNNSGKFLVTYRRLRGPWGGARVSQIDAADCVLIIGGAGGSTQVAYAAITLQKPVIVVASFGGAGNDMWSQLEPFYEKLVSTKDLYGHLHEKWQAGNENIVIKVLHELVKRRLFRRTRHSANFTPLLLNIALFSLWVWLFVQPPEPWQASFFALLAASAFLGSSLRGALRAVLDPADTRTSEALIAEFSAGLVLAFALALLYMAGSFTFTGSAQAITRARNIDDYQRIAVVMGLIGIAGGWLLERVAERLTGIFTDRLQSINKS